MTHPHIHVHQPDVAQIDLDYSAKMVIDNSSSNDRGSIPNNLVNATMYSNSEVGNVSRDTSGNLGITHKVTI